MMSVPSDAMRHPVYVFLEVLCCCDVLRENIGLIVDPRDLIDCDDTFIDIVLVTTI